MYKIDQLMFAIRARLNNDASAAQALDGALREIGPVRTVRVSAAQARGAAKKYAYYGAVRYTLRLDARGRKPINVANERASSDRRSIRLAEQDADDLARNEARLLLGIIGTVDAVTVCRALGVL